MTKKVTARKEKLLLNKYKEENINLKERISKLENALKRVKEDNSQYKNIQQLLNKRNKKLEKEIKVNKWKCHHCETGILKFSQLNIANGISKYFRICSNAKCQNRTPLKNFHDKVEIS